MSAVNLDSTNVPNFVTEELNTIRSFLLQESMNWIQGLVTQNPKLATASIDEVVSALKKYTIPASAPGEKDLKVFEAGKDTLLNGKKKEGSDAKSLFLSEASIIEKIEKRPYTDSEKASLRKAMENSEITAFKKAIDAELAKGTYTSGQEAYISGQVQNATTNADIIELRNNIEKHITKSQKITPFSDKEISATKQYLKSFRADLEKRLQDPKLLGELVQNSSKASFAMYSIPFESKSTTPVQDKKNKAVELHSEIQMPQGVNSMEFLKLGGWMRPYIAAKLGEEKAKDLTNISSKDINEALIKYKETLDLVCSRVEKQSGKKIGKQTREKIAQHIMPAIAATVGKGGDFSSVIDQLIERKSKAALKAFYPDKAIKYPLHLGRYSISTENLQAIVTNFRDQNKDLYNEVCNKLEKQLKEAKVITKDLRVKDKDEIKRHIRGAVVAAKMLNLEKEKIIDSISSKLFEAKKEQAPKQNWRDNFLDWGKFQIQSQHNEAVKPLVVTRVDVKEGPNTIKPIELHPVPVESYTVPDQVQRASVQSIKSIYASTASISKSLEEHQSGLVAKSPLEKSHEKLILQLEELQQSVSRDVINPKSVKLRDKGPTMKDYIKKARDALGSIFSTRSGVYEVTAPEDKKYKKAFQPHVTTSQVQNAKERLKRVPTKQMPKLVGNNRGSFTNI